ncbi:hypothetical protein K437DRAFT_273670 [Tilletiaria anomala UBC 951]|uniref:Uncharacterized protein n=1 Tax=Tilletiaria anomala (strain ATCC 24038 / CBS 436.72 / UBC 951) TaxID=1037660 RepID=A0A066W015_TILAU|nr:uncharacterized protein K437DRAFT_273670 [Tilletiaria anomala UBC 951]KDN47312.1 hypothetical protein K437DRAFT_273670 [Tilletiaria anomala UBC 951]
MFIYEEVPSKATWSFGTATLLSSTAHLASKTFSAVTARRAKSCLKGAPEKQGNEKGHASIKLPANSRRSSYARSDQESRVRPGIASRQQSIAASRVSSKALSRRNSETA